MNGRAKVGVVQHRLTHKHGEGEPFALLSVEVTDPIPTWVDPVTLEVLEQKHQILLTVISARQPDPAVYTSVSLGILHHVKAQELALPGLFAWGWGAKEGRHRHHELIPFHDIELAAYLQDPRKEVKKWKRERSPSS